jgi:PilZ domain
MDHIIERREHTRYAAHHLDVLIKSRRLETGLWETGSVISADFNRFGIGIETEHCFAMGDVLSLIIRTDDSTITEISGVVCNRTPCDSGYRFGVRFIDPEDESEEALNLGRELYEIEQHAAQKLH